jgi:hypothetical protein
VVVPDGKDNQQRNDEQDGPLSQFHVGQEQDDRNDDHREALQGELADAVLDELLEVLDVARHAAHEHARLLFGEEVEAEALKLGEDPNAQVVHHTRGEFSGDVHLLSLEEDAHEGQREIQQRANGDDGEALVSLHAVTNGVLGEERTRLQGQADDDDESRTGEEPLGVDGEQLR